MPLLENRDSKTREKDQREMEERLERDWRETGERLARFGAMADGLIQTNERAKDSQRERARES